MIPARTTLKSIKSFDSTLIAYELTRYTNNKGSVVFLHGLGGDLGIWNEERKQLHEKGYSTIAIDLRGHGLSGRPEMANAYSLENFTQDVQAVLNHEHINKPFLVGHCFGGMICILLAAKRVTLLKGLVLIDTSSKPPRFSGILHNYSHLRYLLAFILPYLPNAHLYGHIDFPSYVNSKDYDWRRILNDIAHVSLKSYLSMCNVLVDYDATELLEYIEVPTLIIEGKNDTIFPPQIARTLHRRIIYSHLQLISDANHILVITNTEDITRQLLKFFHRLE